MGSEDHSRINDYDEGVAAMEAEDYDTAIVYFQKCMKKLSEQGLGLTSDLFPNCLKNIANCYNEKDDMEKALSFKKFEKLYYETVLLHNGIDGLKPIETQNGELEGQSSRDRGDGSSEASGDSTALGPDNDANSTGEDVMESTSGNETTKRAFEYQQLAQLCLQQECVSLALEYSGKATLLYRHHFGDDHEQTKKSFDLFTSIYAEAGKKQYSDSMDQANIAHPNTLDLSNSNVLEETSLRHRNIIGKDDCEGSDDTPNKALKRTRSILKKTSVDAMGENTTAVTPDTPVRRVTFADPLPQMVRLRDDDENDDSSTNLILFILVCMLVILISLLISALICQMNPQLGACVEFRREFTFYYNKLRYFYQSYLNFK